MDIDKRWKIYDSYMDLYKFYWGIAIKLVIFNLGLSGALAAYCIKNKTEPMMAFSLIVPIVFSLFLTWLCHVSKPGLVVAQEEVVRVSRELDIGSEPQFKSLFRFLNVSKLICGLVGVGLVVLVFAVFYKWL